MIILAASHPNRESVSALVSTSEESFVQATCIYFLEGAGFSPNVTDILQ